MAHKLSDIKLTCKMRDQRDIATVSGGLAAEEDMSGGVAALSGGGGLAAATGNNNSKPPSPDPQGGFWKRLSGYAKKVVPLSGRGGGSGGNYGSTLTVDTGHGKQPKSILRSTEVRPRDQRFASEGGMSSEDLSVGDLSVDVISHDIISHDAWDKEGSPFARSASYEKAICSSIVHHRKKTHRRASLSSSGYSDSSHPSSPSPVPPAPEPAPRSSKAAPAPEEGETRKPP